MCGFNFESKSSKANASGGEVNEAAETIASDKESSEKTVETYPSTITKSVLYHIIENTLVYAGEKIPIIRPLKTRKLRFKICMDKLESSFQK